MNRQACEREHMDEITRKSKLMSKIYYFCDRCDRRGEYINLDFINIAPASQRKRTCPADVNPSNELFCPYHDNYQALLDELHEMEAAEDEGEALKSKEEQK